MNKVKPFDIPKREVWLAWQHIRANQGAAGVDGQSIQTFEADLARNLYKLKPTVLGKLSPTPCSPG